jgi:hypothetical protein
MSACEQILPGIRWNCVHREKKKEEEAVRCPWSPVYLSRHYLLASFTIFVVNLVVTASPKKVCSD